MLRWSVSEGLQGGRRPQVSSLPIGFSAALGNAQRSAVSSVVLLELGESARLKDCWPATPQ
jgi:hypothetical protein